MKRVQDEKTKRNVARREDENDTDKPKKTVKQCKVKGLFSIKSPPKNTGGITDWLIDRK